MRLPTFCLLGFSLLATVALPAQGGGNLNPGLPSNAAAVERFRDLKVGLSVHWGPSSLGGEEISWARGEQIPRSRYDSFYLAFDPARFDAREWVSLARRGGMRYIVPTSKHHDGFALWHSEVSPYDMEATPYGKDIVAPLAEACRDSGLVFGTYYSIIDWYHPDYLPYDHGGPGPLIEQPGDTVDFDRYLAYMKSQLRELVVDYGAEIVQLDGEWVDTWTHRLGSDLYLYLRKLDDDVIVNSRVDLGRYDLAPDGRWRTETYAGDYDERERMVDWIDDAETREFRPTATPWQAWATVDRAQSAYNPTGTRLQSPDSLLVDLVETVGGGGNYLLNLGPRPDGTFVPEEVAIVEEVGAWLNAHADAIYGTRGGPFVAPGSYTSTVSKDGSTVYLFVFDATLSTLPIVSRRAIRAFETFTGASVPFTRGGDDAVLSLPPGGDIRVYRMRMAPE